ncbi:MAG: ABC transporter ATP-binding protein [Acidobacteriota bacterium]
MPAVEIRNLTKDYEGGTFVKKKRRALDHLTLDIEEGEIFGLIGPNGAGKTTTLKLLMGLIFPSEGGARILGRPMSDVAVKSQLGYLPENPYFYDYLTGRELLDYYGQLFGLSRAERRGRVAELLERVGLLEAGDLQLRKYSKGMVQRLGVAQAVLNNPRVLFLDEPMSGLDPVGRRDMTLLIQELHGSGVTVLFSSHILPDVESLCQRVAILNQGKLVREGRLEEILDLSVHAIEVIVENLPEAAEEELEAVAQQVHRLGHRMKLEFGAEGGVEKALELIRENGARLISVNPVKQTLEEYFVHEVTAAGPVERQKP